MSSVYAYAQAFLRKRLWHDLSQIPEYRHGAWVLIGDLFAIKRLSEKKGGSTSIPGYGFADFISESGLIDLGFVTLHLDQESFF